MSQRIPVSLQQVFLESQRGTDVENIKAPTSGEAIKIFAKPKPSGLDKTIKAPGATALRRPRKKGDSAADAFRKANPSVVEKKYPDDSPQAFLEKELVARGYSTKKYVSLEGGYYSRPTLLQKASFGSIVNEAINTSDAALLRRLLDAGLSPNPCNDFGESLVHRICRRGDHKLLTVLLEKGCCLQIADDYGRTPLHDALWNANPSAEVLNLILKTDKHLIQLMDCRGFVPLDYVRKEAYGDVIEYFKAHMDEFYPPRDASAGEEAAPPLTKKKPDSTPVPDPRLALTPQTAALVANGEIEPEDAIEWDDVSDDSEYDSDDSYYDSEDDYDDEEMAEFCMRAGGPLAVARNCFGQSCQVMSRSHKLN
eukprot:scaffold809_cov118-Cylindrotheca_fusiformis.AAC.2